MQRTIRAFLVATMLLQPVIACAETPDEAGAKKIEEAVKTHGPAALRKPGLLKVSPDGDGYRMVFDVGGLLAGTVAPMTVTEAATRIVKLVAQPDGLWAFDSSGPVVLKTEYLAANRSANLSVAAETSTMKGMFDPTLRFARRADFGFTNGVANLRNATDVLKLMVGNGGLSLTVKDISDGVRDADATFSIHDATATHGAFPQPEVKVSAQRIEGLYKLGGLDMAGLGAIGDFWRVSAPGKEVSTLTEAQRRELETMLAKHVSLIDEISGGVTACDLATLEAGKGFKLEKLDYQTRWERLNGGGTLVTSAKIANLGVDPGVWPKGLEALLPKEATFNVTLSGIDMGALLKDSARIRTEREYARLPAEYFAKILLPSGTLTIDFSDSFVRSSIYDLTFSGQAKITMAKEETASALYVVTAKDLDRTIKYFQDNTATVPIFGRFSTMATMAKGFGKPGLNGTTVWEVKIEGTSKVTINGQELPI